MRMLLLVLSLLGPLERLDWDVAHAVQQARRPALERPMRFATELGKPVVVAGGVVLAALADRAAGGAAALAAVAALAGANLVVEALKRATFRARPDGEHRRSNASFPSGHAASAFALAWTLARRWRRLGVPLFALAATVTFSRLYLNRHFLSDVVVGAALGLLCAWAVSRWLPSGRAHGRPVEPTAP